MPLGAHGHVDFHHDPASGRVRARSRLRGYDGVCRAVTRWAATRTESEARLLEALIDQAVFSAGDWTGGTPVAAAIGLWRADLEASSLAPATANCTRPQPACTSNQRSAGFAWASSPPRSSTVR